MRYELVLLNDQNEEESIIFVIDEKEKKKVDLFTIDNMTTNFENQGELLRFLAKNGYNTNNIQSVYIRYIYDKKAVTLDVCYMEDYLFGKNKGAFELKNSSFNRFIEYFVTSLKDGKFLRYVLDAKRENGNVLYPELKQIIEEYSYNNHPNSKSAIKMILQNYKQARDIYFLTKKYRGIQFKNNHQFNPYSSDEEEKSYMDYLDNLPPEMEDEKHLRIKTSVKKIGSK